MAPKKNNFKKLCKIINDISINTEFTFNDILKNFDLDISKDYIKQTLGKFNSCKFIENQKEKHKKYNRMITVSYKKLKQIPEDITITDLDLLSRRIDN